MSDALPLAGLRVARVGIGVGRSGVVVVHPVARHARAGAALRLQAVGQPCRQPRRGRFDQRAARGQLGLPLAAAHRVGVDRGGHR